MPTAMVTGASRGIGKATAGVALADAGFDVALTARTLHEGEGVDDSDVGRGRPVVGSLEATAAEVGARGRRALSVRADLLDPASLEAAAARVLAEWGGVDVLVNNAVHTGPGSMTRFLDTTVEQLEAKLAGNVVGQVVLIRTLLPSMLAAGGGRIVNVSSHVAVGDPPGPVGDGGWGYAYAASKAAFARVAPILAVEHGRDGIRCYNLDPGTVTTERMAANAAALGIDRYPGAPPSAPAAAIAWLATAPADEAAALNGTTVRGLKLVLERDLHPDWR